MSKWPVLFSDIQREVQTEAVLYNSSHNQHIEHFWVDVYLGVVYMYYCVFAFLEMEQLLHLDDEIDMFCLHYVHRFQINKYLEESVVKNIQCYNNL